MNGNMSTLQFLSSETVKLAYFKVSNQFGTCLMNIFRKLCLLLALLLRSFSFKTFCIGNKTSLKFRKYLKNGVRHSVAGLTFSQFLTLQIFKLNCQKYTKFSSQLMQSGESLCYRRNNPHWFLIVLINTKLMKTFNSATNNLIK